MVVGTRIFVSTKNSVNINNPIILLWTFPSRNYGELNINIKYFGMKIILVIGLSAVSAIMVDVVHTTLER